MSFVGEALAALDATDASDDQPSSKRQRSGGDGGGGKALPPPGQDGATIAIGQLMLEVAKRVSSHVEEKVAENIPRALTTLLPPLFADLGRLIIESVTNSLIEQVTGTIADRVEHVTDRVEHLTARLEQGVTHATERQIVETLLQEFQSRVTPSLSTAVTLSVTRSFQQQLAQLSLRQVPTARSEHLLGVFQVTALVPYMPQASWGASGVLVHLLDVHTLRFQSLSASSQVSEIPTSYTVRCLDDFAKRLNRFLRYQDCIVLHEGSINTEAAVSPSRCPHTLLCTEPSAANQSVITLGGKLLEYDEVTPCCPQTQQLIVKIYRPCSVTPWPLHFYANSLIGMRPDAFVAALCQLCGTMKVLNEADWSQSPQHLDLITDCRMLVRPVLGSFARLSTLPVETPRHCDCRLPRPVDSSEILREVSTCAYTPLRELTSGSGFVYVAAVITSVARIDYETVVLTTPRTLAITVELGDPSISPLLQLQAGGRADCTTNPIIAARLLWPPLEGRLRPLPRLCCGDVILLHRFKCVVKQFHKNKQRGSAVSRIIIDLLPVINSSWSVYATEDLFTPIAPQSISANAQYKQSLATMESSRRQSVIDSGGSLLASNGSAPTGNSSGTCADLILADRQFMEEICAMRYHCLELPQAPSPRATGLAMQEGNRFTEPRFKTMSIFKWDIIRKLAAWAGEQLMLTLCVSSDYTHSLVAYLNGSCSFGDVVARVERCGMVGSGTPVEWNNCNGAKTWQLEISDSTLPEGSTETTACPAIRFFVTSPLLAQWCAEALQPGDIVRIRNAEWCTADRVLATVSSAANLHKNSPTHAASLRRRDLGAMQPFGPNVCTTAFFESTPNTRVIRYPTSSLVALLISDKNPVALSTAT